MKKLFGLLLFALAFPSIASAANPACGDTLTVDTTLVGDLDCSTYAVRGALILGPNVTLDGAGFKIIAPLVMGVNVKGANATVKNVKFGDFTGYNNSYRAIEVRAPGVTVENIDVKNYYGGVVFIGNEAGVSGTVRNSRMSGNGQKNDINWGGGVELYNVPDVSLITISNNTLTKNNNGILIRDSGTTSLKKLNVTTTNLSENNRAFMLYYDKNIELDGTGNIALNSLNTEVDTVGSTGHGIVLRNWLFEYNLGGLARGYSVNIIGDNVVLENIVSRNRQWTYVNGSDVTVRGCTVDRSVASNADSRTGGLNIGKTNMTVENNTLTNNPAGIWLQSGNTTFKSFKGNSIKNNKYAIVLDSTYNVVIDNDKDGTPRNIFEKNENGVYQYNGDIRNITIQNIDLSWDGVDYLGYATYLNSNNGTFKNIVVKKRQYGLYLNGSGNIIQNSSFIDNKQASDGWSYQLHPGNNPTIDNNLFDTGYNGIFIQSSDGMASFTNNTFKNLIGGIVYNACKNIVFEGAQNNKFITVENPFRNYGGNQSTNLTFRNLDIPWDGAGYVGTAISMYGSSLTVQNVKTAKRLNYGIFFTGSTALIENSSIQDTLNSGGSGSGIYVESGQDLTIRNTTMGNNQNALFLSSYKNPLVLDGADFRGSDVAIRMQNTTVTIDNAANKNFFGNNKACGICNWNGNNNDVILKNINLSWDGTGRSGTGISLNGRNMIIDNITVNNRDYGFNNNGSNYTIQNSDFSKNRNNLIYLDGVGSIFDNNTFESNAEDGLIILPSTGEYVKKLTVTNNNFKNIGRYAFRLEYYQDAITFESNNFTGSNSAIYLTRISRTSFVNALAGDSKRNTFANNRDYGVLMNDTTSDNVLFQNFDFTGGGAGYGIFARGRNITIDSVIADNRQYGIRSLGTSQIVQNSSAKNSKTAGIWLANDSGIPAVENTTIVNNDMSGALEDSFLVQNAKGPMSPLKNNMSSSLRCIRIQNTDTMTLSNGAGTDANNTLNCRDGIYADGTHKNLTLDGFDVSATAGLGYGVIVVGTGATVKNIKGNGHNIGLELQGTGGTATNNEFKNSVAYGLNITPGAGFPTVANTKINYNNFSNTVDRAVRFGAYRGAIEFKGNNVSNAGGFVFYVSGTNDMVINNATSGADQNITGNTIVGIYGDGTSSGNTFSNFDFSGNGTGYCVAFQGNVNTFESLNCDKHQYGFSLTGNDYIVRNSTSRAHTQYGIITNGTMKEISGLDASNNTTGQAVYLQNQNGNLIFANNNMSNAPTGLYITGSTGIIIDNAIAKNIFGNNNTNAISATMSSSKLSNFNLSGNDLGYAMALYGSSNVIENSSVKKFNQGFRFQGNENILKDSLARGNTYGVLSYGLNNKVQNTRICWNNEGLHNGANEVVFADTNYWGTPFGPRVPDYPEGTGNPITNVWNKVKFKPFLTVDPVGVGCESEFYVRRIEIEGLQDGIAGVPQNIKVVAYDALGAPTNQLTGKVKLVSSDPLATWSPVDADFVNGVATITLTPKTKGDLKLTAYSVKSPELFDEVIVKIFVGPAAKMVLVSGDAQKGAVGDQLSLPLMVRITDAGGNLLQGIRVDFAPLNPDAIVQTEASVTNDQGIAQTFVTLAPTLGTQQFTATSGTLEGSPLTFTETAVPGPVAALKIENLPDSSIAGQTAGFLVRAVDRFGNTNPTYKGPVRFTSTDAKAKLPANSALQNGEASFEGTFFTRSSNTQLSVSDVSALALSGSDSLSVLAADASKITYVSGSAQAAVVNTVAIQPIIAAVVDAYGNTIPDYEVTFTTKTAGASVVQSVVLSDADGLAKAMVKLSPVAGGNDFSATAGSPALSGAPIQYQLIGQADVPAGLSYVSGSGLSGVVGKPLGGSLVVAVTDAYGNRTLAGTVDFAPQTAGVGSVTAASVTNVNGNVQTSVVLGTTAGSQKFVASASFTDQTVIFEEIATADVAAKLTLVSGDAQTGVVGSILSNPFIVKVTDQYDNTVAGEALIASTTTATAGISPPQVVTATNGTAQLIGTLATRVGENTYSVRLNNESIAPVTFTATGIASDGSKLTLTNVPTSIDAGVPFTVTVTAYDRDGNVAKTFTGPVKILTTDGSAVLPELTTLVDGVATLTITLNKAGLQTISAADEKGTIRTDTVPVLVNAGAIAGITITPNNASSTVNNPVTLTLQLVDIAGNPVLATASLDLEATNNAVFTSTSLNGTTGIGTKKIKGNTNNAGFATVAITDGFSESTVVTVTGASIGATTATVTFISGASRQLLLTAKTGTISKACGCLDFDIQLADETGVPVLAPLSGITLETTGSARISTTTLSNVAENSYPAASVIGDLNDQGAATITVCGKTIEKIDLSAVQAQITGRVGKINMNFTRGALDIAKTTFVTDATSVQAGLGKAVITAVPMDECGNSWGDDAAVVLSAQGDGLLTPVKTKNGEYTSEMSVLTCPATGNKTTVISGTVNSVALPTPITINTICIGVSPENTAITMSKKTQSVCNGQTDGSIVMTIIPRDTNNVAMNNAQITVTGDGVDAKAVVNEGGGVYTVEMNGTTCGTTPVQLTVKINGVEIVRDSNKVTFTCCIGLSTDNTSITLSKKTQAICKTQTDGAMVMSIMPRDTNNAPITNASIVVSGEGVESKAVVNEGGGVYTAEITGKTCSATAVQLTVKINDIAIVRDANKVTLTCPTLDTNSLTLSVNKAQITANGTESAAITVSALNTCKEAFANGAVTVESKLGATLAAKTGVTDAQGVFVTQVTSTTVGEDSISGSVNDVTLKPVAIKYVLSQKTRTGGGVASACGCSSQNDSLSWIVVLGALSVLMRRKKNHV